MKINNVWVFHCVCVCVYIQFYAIAVQLQILLYPVICKEQSGYSEIRKFYKKFIVNIGDWLTALITSWKWIKYLNIPYMFSNIPKSNKIINFLIHLRNN